MLLELIVGLSVGFWKNIIGTLTKTIRKLQKHIEKNASNACSGPELKSFYVEYFLGKSLVRRSDLWR